MRQYTTPRHHLFIPDFQLVDCDIYVTYSDKQRRRVVTINNPSVELEEAGTNLYVDLTQEMTGTFFGNEQVDIQVNWMKNGKRYATEIKTIRAGENLIKEVM